ncbi:MAG: DUF4432 family protein [Kiritimatiellae bacterium]|nr:DUF4432 family protein [Kiritimatiellia bacterium]
MKINLANLAFTDKPTPLAEEGEFKVAAFRYPSGVAALRVTNRRGGFTILPWMGQMIWRCDFDGRELAMKSMYDEPKNCRESFSDSYGCFLMHCGLTAMGNPTPEDTHIGHAELPVARYQSAYVEFGADKTGPFVAVGGSYRHDLCFTYNYVFSPRVVLRRGAAKIEVSATVRNDKDLPLEYYYLCHVNHRPVDGSKIVESPLKRPPIVNHEVPADYYKPWGDATNAWLAVLDKDYKAQSVVGAKGESYRPEIVNCYFHKPDKAGWAVVKQVYPKKAGGVFVKYRPSELPYATRWIARTADEDAIGMCLPATAEHKGRLFCRAHKEQRCLAPGRSVTFHVETGIL